MSEMVIVASEGAPPNSHTEVDRNVRDDDLSSNCPREKPPNQGLLLTARCARGSRGPRR